jgi:phospholipid/cholesterol/gamma-HCH transport system permease protein
VPSRAQKRDFRAERSGDAVRLLGRLRTRDAAALLDAVRGARRIDVAGVEELDGGVAALLTEQRVELAGAHDRIAELLELHAPGATKPPRPRRCEGFVAGVGRGTHVYLTELRSIATFLGEMARAALRVVKRPRAGNLREVPVLVERAGADAVPIVLLINFLVGFVMAYQSSRQLQKYGANVYVADVVGISVTRELAPLMTAIIVCGRTGAAYAAEIGSMKVDEEIDALRTLGLTPFGFLVVPRVIALVIVLPILTALGDVFGTLGGLLVAVTSLDVTARGYAAELETSVLTWDVQAGLIKSVMFALAIGLVACQQGFSASGGAEGVGRRTTTTVVTCLFALVLIDALATLVFRLFGA